MDNIHGVGEGIGPRVSFVVDQIGSQRECNVSSNFALTCVVVVSLICYILLYHTGMVPISSHRHTILVWRCLFGHIGGKFEFHRLSKLSV